MPNARYPVLKALSSTIFGLLLVIGLANAEVSVYNVDGRFEAAFPSSPQIIGEAGAGDFRMRGFNSTDQTNLISYTASYQLKPAKLSEPTIEDALRDFVNGQVLVVKGKLVHQSIGSLGGKPGVQFIIAFEYSGIPARKYGASIHYDGRFYQWTIQDIPGISKQDGLALFKEYVKYFRVK